LSYMAITATASRVHEGMLVRALSKRYGPRQDAARDYQFFAGVKTGPTNSNGVLPLSIFDAIAIARSWTFPEVIGFEVKCSRGDYLSDSKWPRYLNYCHRFYWVCPNGLIASEEPGPQTGLIWFNPLTGTLHTKRKAPYRQVDIPASFYLYLLMNRLEPERHPFFSDRREQLEAWVADKPARHALSNAFRGRCITEVRQLTTELEQARRERDRYKADHEQWVSLKALLQEEGVWHGDWDWQHTLREALLSAVPVDALRLAHQIAEQSARLRAILEPTPKKGGDAAK